MERLSSALRRCVGERNGAVLAAFALGAAIAAAAASRVELDSGIESLMLRNDPDLERNRAFKREFSNDEILVVALDFGRPFDLEVLGRVRGLSARLAVIEGVEEVIDLSNVEDVRGDGEALDASPLIDWTAVQPDLARIRERARDHRLYRRTLLSPDLEVLAQVVVLEPDATETGRSDTATEQVIALLEEFEPTCRCETYLAGYPVTSYDGNRIMTRDLSLLGALAFALIAATLAVAYRSWLPVLLGGALALWSELAALGYFGLTGTPITATTSIVPPLLLALSSAYVIYFVGMLRTVAAEPEPALAALDLLIRPVALSATTTSAGFLSLYLIPVKGIGELGIALTVGNGAAALGCLLLLPALVRRCAARPRVPRLRGLERLGTLGVDLAPHRAPVFACAAAITALVGAGAAYVRVESNPLAYFEEDSRQIRSVEFIRERIGATLLVNVIVGGEGPDSALAPEVLGFAAEISRLLEENPRIDRTLSFLDYLHLMDSAIQPDSDPDRLPTGDLAAQYLLLYEAGGDPNDLRHYLSPDRSRLNVIARLNRRNASDILAVRDSVLLLAQGAPEGVSVEVLGSTVLFGKAMDGVTRGMIKGLATSLIAIFVVMAVALSSIRFALVALVPNVVPVIACAGFLGWTGGTLSFGTSIMGCVVLGLAVDDTAHVIGHLGEGRTLHKTFRDVGPALILTTLCLGLGFGVLTLSEFAVVRTLGLATVVTLLAALLCDLLLLPALLDGLGPRVRASESFPHPRMETRGDLP